MVERIRLHQNQYNKKRGSKIPLIKVLAVKGGSCIATARSEALLLFKKPLVGFGATPRGLFLLLHHFLPADNEVRDKESGDNQDQRANRQYLLTANLDAEEPIAVALYVRKNATAEQRRAESA